MNESERELLSAYIDGRLTADEAAALERRLATDSALRLELDTLRETQLLLRGLPMLRAPRRLTLTPAMVRPRSRPLYLSAWVSVASAAAALVLVAAGLLTLNASAPSASMMVQQSPQDVAAIPTSSASPTTLPTLTREDDGQAQDNANAAPPFTAIPAAEARTATTASPDAALMAAPAAEDSALGAAASGIAESAPATTADAADVSGELETAAEMQFAATMPAQPTPAAPASLMTAQTSPPPTMTARPSATATLLPVPTAGQTAQIAQLPTLTSDVLPQEAARQDDRVSATPSLILIVTGVVLLLFALVTTLLRLRRR